MWLAWNATRLGRGQYLSNPICQIKWHWCIARCRRVVECGLTGCSARTRNRRLPLRGTGCVPGSADVKPHETLFRRSTGLVGCRVLCWFHRPERWSRVPFRFSADVCGKVRSSVQSKWNAGAYGPNLSRSNDSGHAGQRPRAVQMFRTWHIQSICEVSMRPNTSALEMAYSRAWPAVLLFL